MKTVIFLSCFILVSVAGIHPSSGQATSDNSNVLFTSSDDDMELEDLPSEDTKDTTEADKMLRLRRMVQSATKGETTVQEAPAVITIFTEDDINDYGFRSVFGAFQFIPSVLTANAQYDNIPIITSNGLSQGILLVQDGISLFDSIQNGMANMRRWPLELVKRIEFMSSPGGVLWGANSFLGIASIITKEAEDINGVQMGVGGGTGPGDQDVFRTYGIFGKTYGDLS
ncbi:TonB-dependent receptor plug domain-containing protein, partial [Myxococcota bacterium]|nr:TonB-dependent receptor plug domain-containing protein [Myxococcota bacterium]